MTTVVAAAAVFDPARRGPGRVALAADGTIEEVTGPGPADVEVPILAPGFVDLQCNGAGSFDFRRGGDAVWAGARAALAATGATTVLPTLVSGTEVDAALDGYTPAGVPEFTGLHLEGPMLSPRRAGAHDEHALAPVDVALALARPVRLVTLAPEVPGALAVTEQLVAGGVTVSAGHTDATAEEAHAAFDAGVALVTHLWNAMAPLGHRSPGLVGAALADARVRVCLICDGVHVDPLVVRLTWGAVGPGRLVAVTDSVGLDEAAVAAGWRVRGAAVVGRDGRLRGSAVTMDRVVANLVAWGLPPADAFEAVTATPAAAVGLTDRGRLSPGLRGDMVALDPQLRVLHVWSAGR